MAEVSINAISEGLKDLTISKSEIEPVGEEIGRGAYGRVFTVKYCGHICAVKEIHSILVEGVGEQEQKSVKEDFLRECHHCSVLKHPNIVRFLGIYYPQKDSKIPAMIMELMDESLTAYMKKLPKTALMRKGSILLDVAEGLSYLHALTPAVIHRDLSPNNILLKKGKGEVPVAKISDLGVAKVVKADSRATRSKLTKAPGTVDFMAPEALQPIPDYGVELDVFSFAGIVLFVCTHKWPTPTAQVLLDPETEKPIAFTEVERRQEYLDEMTGEAKGLRPLVESCLSNNPAKRPTIAEASKRIKESPPLLVALQTGCYEITWEKCADLPSPMYSISAVLHDRKAYIMAGIAPDDDTLYNVYCYNITTDQWEQLPPPGHYMGRLHIIDGKLSVIGGRDNVIRKISNKVTTYINNNWTDHFPNLLRARIKPGVVSHSEYVIVAGVARDKDTIYDDIEILNTTQPYQWIMTNILLPEPIRSIFPTISDNKTIIVGYSRSTGRYNRVYQVPVDIITSSTTTSNQPVQWMELPRAPHYETITIPNSHPPVIMGGCDLQGVPTSDVSMLDESTNKWNTVSSLSSPRDCVAVVPIDSDTILVLGGTTGGVGIAGHKAHSITTVEKGRATLTQRTAAIPTEDTQCSIQ